MAKNTEARLEREDVGTVVITGTKGMESLKQTIHYYTDSNDMQFYTPQVSYDSSINHKYIASVDTATLSQKISTTEIPKYNHGKIGYHGGEPGIQILGEVAPIPKSYSDSAEGIPMSTGTVIMNNDGKFELKMNDVSQLKKYPATPEGVDQEWWDAEMAKADEYYSDIAKKGFRTWNDKPERGLIQNIGVGHTISAPDVIGMSNGNARKAPIICRSYDNFVATIQKLYGPKPETPTLIPVAILFQFELNEEHYNIEYKPERRYRDDYDDDYSGNKNYLVKERRQAGYHEIPDSGFSCILWLIENNYIPAYYSIHTDEDEIHELMSETLYGWMNGNNFRDN
mgnify:CR=1 FL=1